VAEGDLSQKMALTIEGQPFRGEFARIGSIVNAMVAQLQAFANEVTRVAREVGTEGALGGQAEVPGVAGHVEGPHGQRELHGAQPDRPGAQRGARDHRRRAGRPVQKITVNAQGEMLELKSTINTMVDQLRSFARGHARGARGRHGGPLGGQAEVPGVAGTWKDLTENVNFMAGNLTSQVRNIAEVTTAVPAATCPRRSPWTCAARSASSRTPSTGWSTSCAPSPTRSPAWRARSARRASSAARRRSRRRGHVARPDRQRELHGGEPHGQVRGIAVVTTAVAQGDLSQKITVDAQGEILELKSTINTMVDQLRSFADEVTRVAREVGTEGRLGGQAEVAACRARGRA
jgi:HAMP domain-containing protein